MNHITQEPSKEEFALGSFLAAMYESNLDGRAMRAAMLKALGMDSAALAQPEPVEPEYSEHFSVVMGCARTYAYEYSQKDDRLINAAYKRLEFNLRAAIAAAKGGAL